MAPENRDGAAVGGGVGELPEVGAGGCEAPPGATGTGGAGPAGVASPSAAGRARSIRFSNDMCSVLPSAACEEAALRGLIGLGGLGSVAGEGAGEGDDVARERRLGMTNDERH